VRVVTAIEIEIVGTDILRLSEIVVSSAIEWDCGNKWWTTRWWVMVRLRRKWEWGRDWGIKLRS